MHKFSSKKDWWVLAFLICLTGLLVQLLLTMQAKGQISLYPVHTATYVLTVIVLWWPIFNTRYIVKEDDLVIHCLFLTWKIKRADIKDVSITNNSIASPALSLDRLRIDYIENGKAKFVLVSPKSKQSFCETLGLTLN